MDMVFIYTKTEEDMKDSILMTKSMGTAFTPGLTAANTRAIGSMESKTDTENTHKTTDIFRGCFGGSFGECFGEGFGECFGERFLAFPKTQTSIFGDVFWRSQKHSFSRVLPWEDPK